MTRSDGALIDSGLFVCSLVRSRAVACAQAGRVCVCWLRGSALACLLACVRLARGRALGGPRGLAMVVLHFGICRSAVAGCTERGREHEAGVRTARPEARQAHPPRGKASKRATGRAGWRRLGADVGPIDRAGPTWAHPRPHLHRDWAPPTHICTGTGLTPPAHCSHICTAPPRRATRLPPGRAGASAIGGRSGRKRTHAASRMPTDPADAAGRVSTRAKPRGAGSGSEGAAAVRARHEVARGLRARAAMRQTN